MKKGYKEFSETVKHLDKEDLIRQLYLAVNTPTKSEIPWQKYDPENPPKFNELYLVLANDGRHPRTAELVEDGGRNLFWTENGYVASKVTHYCPINLQGRNKPDEINRTDLNQKGV